MGERNVKEALAQKFVLVDKSMGHDRFVHNKGKIK